MANHRQGRVNPHFYLFATFILSSCFGISYFSRFHNQSYQRYRRPTAFCWRLFVLSWPSFLILMRNSPIRLTQKMPIMTAFFGSSLFSNLITTICMPLLLSNSFVLNILVSIRHLLEQYDVCNTHQVTCTSAAGLASQFWDVLGVLNPFGLGRQVPSMDVLSPPKQCFLVYFTSEIAVLFICWWSAWFIERQSRIRFLRRMHVEELERKGGSNELFYLMVDDPLGVGVRIGCFLLFGLSLLWAGVLISHGTTTTTISSF